MARYSAAALATIVLLSACGDDAASGDTDTGAAEESSGGTGGDSTGADSDPSTSGVDSSDTSADETGSGGETEGDTGEIPGCDAVGFADPSVWSLPDISALPLNNPDDAAHTMAADRSCENDEDFRFVIMDLTGDGQVDYVITDGCDAQGVGTDRWIVHPGEDGGFGGAQTWTLPDISALPLTNPDDAAHTTAADRSCENDEDFRFVLMDLTGDGRVDYVITDGCDAQGVGSERWIVHPGEDGGFGGAQTWTLPDISALPLTNPDDAAHTTVADRSCENDEDFRFLLMDLTGDGQVDYVITDACDATGVGSDRWIVHPGEDGGFGGAQTWSLPDISALPLTNPDDAAHTTAADRSCENDEDFRFVLMDLTGDGQTDYVITDGCDAAGVGAERWIVHPGEDGGFGGAQTWSLPDVSALPLNNPDDVAHTTAADRSCENDEDFRFVLMDLTNDGRPDYVITDGCDAAGVGAERWIVHPGEDGGFGGAQTWSLPDVSAMPLNNPDDAAHTTAADRSCENDEDFRFVLSELHGDGALDYVITDGCDAQGVGSDRWIVHAGTCE